ncbi:hypothetical protein BJX99DRAFT_257981 [Aspergillus californicus]
MASACLHRHLHLSPLVKRHSRLWSLRTLSRHILPHDGTPLSKWLEQANRISKRVKVILAYTIAKSVWQYYNSYWMITTCTSKNIQFLREKNSVVDHVQPHVFFVTKLFGQENLLRDVCEGDDLIHIYANILALGVLLIEIATFKLDDRSHWWDETTLDDYCELAYTAAQSGDVTQTVGDVYAGVVNSCLDPELFRDRPIDLSKHAESFDVRRLRLFEKVVAPLQRLYHVYRDDWGMQDMTAAKKGFEVSALIQTEQDAIRKQSTIAVICALPIEANAVVELFDEVWSEQRVGKATGDRNAYTLGSIGKKDACKAASCAQSSYPAMKLALVVGICGAVPSCGNIILGDVVISEGIVQYDFGRQYPDTFTARAGHEVVCRPPREIQTTLSKLNSARAKKILQAKLLENLEAQKRQPGPLKTFYPGPDQDELFQPQYHHQH